MSKFNVVVVDECGNDLVLDSFKVPSIKGIDEYSTANFIFAEKYEEYVSQYPEARGFHVEKDASSMSRAELEFFMDCCDDGY